MAKVKAPKIDVGIPRDNREAVAQGLSRLLADEYTLYLMTHNFHWNVTGPLFNTLHTMFEAHYTESAMAVDQVAERIRALGFPAPGTYRQYAELSSIEEESGVPEALEMVRLLVKAHEACAKTARSIFAVAEEGDDEVTADLLTQRLQVHEKTAWMLRSILQ
jgi:starvation-inducible DNA-binding protein